MLQRSLVALTALKLGLASRAQLLHLHHVTEADLCQHRADWERLQALRAATATLPDQPRLRRA